MKENYKEFISNIKNDKLDKALVEAKEEKKKGNKKAKKVIIIVDSIIALILIFVISITNIYSLIALPFAMVFTAIIDLIISSSFVNHESEMKYNKLYKETVIDGILKNFFYEVDYVPKKQMPEGIYDDATGERYDVYNSDDYVEGIVDNKYKIKMAEITTEEIREEKDSKGNVERRYYTIFSGLFAKIDLKKSIKSTLIIEEGAIYRADAEVLKMDSSVFEKCFKTITNNKIIAMQILTPDIMEMLLEFKKKTNTCFDVIIDENTMYIRFHVGRMFETYLSDKTAINDKQTEEYFNIVKFIYMLTAQIIEVIDNTEI